MGQVPGGGRGDRAPLVLLARDGGAARDAGQTSCPAELLYRVGGLERWARNRSRAASGTTDLD